MLAYRLDRHIQNLNCQCTSAVLCNELTTCGFNLSSALLPHWPHSAATALAKSGMVQLSIHVR